MLSLMRWLSRRSLATLHVWGACMGWLVYALSPSYRRRLRANTALAGVTPADRHRAVAETGRMVAELPRLWLRPFDQPLGPLVRWQGAELVDAAIQAGRGVVFLTPHLGCFEVTAQAITERFAERLRLTVMYRPARQAWLREIEETARRRPGLETVPAALAGVRQMIRALRRGESVGLLPDQVPPEGMGVWVPFFGQPAYTMTLAARLVQQTGAVLLTVWAERLPKGAGYVMRVSAPDRPLPTQPADAQALAAACAMMINEEMERLIRAAPGQYLWGYHRYKQPRRADPAGVEEGAAR